MAIKIAINGFGRIGRAAFKVAWANKDVEVVAVNDLTDNKSLAYLLKYDTVYGRYQKPVEFSEQYLIVDGKKFKALSEPDPAKLPWKDMDIDVILECTGVFTTPVDLNKHIEAGARHVILSTPVKGEGVNTYILGVNQDRLQAGEEKIVANASCTTNCIAPVAEIMQREFGVKKATITTIHSYTASQTLVDGPHKKDPRRGRSAAENIVPTSTGAAAATTKTIPELEGLFDGVALRVPTPIVSISDMVFVVGKKTSKDEVNDAFKREASSPRYKGILGVTQEPVVSSDFIGDPRSSIVDLSLTQVVDEDLVKLFSWYDNEWGYSNRLVEQAIDLGKSA